MVILFAAASRSRRAFFAGFAWLAFTGFIAKTGGLSDASSMPPNIGLLLIPTFVCTIILVFSKFGDRIVSLPLTLLVGYQSFRIFVEISIHRAVVEGVAPPQVSWTGLNWDIISGVTALILIPFVKRLPKVAVLIWNTLALGLLLTVVLVSTLSFPSPLQQMKPDNVWIAHFPFLWLPTVAVTCALIGHLAIYRKLLGKKKPRPAS